MAIVSNKNMSNRHNMRQILYIMNAIHPVYYTDSFTNQSTNVRLSIPVWIGRKLTLSVTTDDKLQLLTADDSKTLPLEGVKSIGIEDRNRHKLLVLRTDGNLYQCNSLSCLDDWTKMELIDINIIDLVLNRHTEVVFSVTRDHRVINHQPINIQLPLMIDIKSLRHCSIVTNDNRVFVMISTNNWIQIEVPYPIIDAVTSYNHSVDHPAIFLTTSMEIVRAKYIDRQQYTFEFELMTISQSIKRLIDITSISISHFKINMVKVFEDINGDLRIYNCEKNTDKVKLRFELHQHNNQYLVIDDCTNNH